MKAELFLNTNFLLSVVVALCSIITFELRLFKSSVFLLCLSSILAGIFIATADPFLHIWDEQFHALVAKNMIENPFKPILIKEPLFGFDKYNWSAYHIWMHKQPLFLWQMALSLKVFGLTEIGVRFPSILMHAIMVIFIYRSGSIMHSRNVGFYASFLFTFCYFPLEYISGTYATDHNDIAFLFYDFAALWSLLEYYTSKKKVFFILIGVFAGCAILCKWLPGLMVFGIWSLLIFFNRKTSAFKKELIPFSFSFLICSLIFIPWQIYCAINYPIEYKTSMDFNLKHITTPLEGHGGGYDFYYHAMYEQFGEGFLIPIIILGCFLYAIYTIKNLNHRVILSMTIIITYSFFTLVKTKMYGYVFIVIPFLILTLTYVIYKAARLLILLRSPNRLYQKIIIPIIMIISAILLFDSNKIYKRHSNKEVRESRNIKIKEKEMYLAISKKFSNGRYLVFNCNTSVQSNIISMFYTDFPSFGYVLPQYQIDQAISLNYKLIAINDGKLPDYVNHNPDIIKITFE